jgi:photosystem II stability/assembly factor-like uncharacterized protein
VIRGARAAALAAALIAATPSGLGAQEGRDEATTSLTLFAGTRQGLRRSQDWGNTWQAVEGKGLEGLGSVYAILASAPRVLVGGDGGLYVSEDFGGTWKPVFSAKPVLSIMLSRYPLSDPTVFLGTPTGLLRSSDGGATFGSTPLEGVEVYRIEWPGPDLFVASGRGVSASGNAATSFRDGEGLPAARVAALAVSSFYSVDPVLFAGTAGAGVFRSTDGGRNWKARGLEGRFVNDIYWQGPILSAATDKGFYQSDDDGVTWTARSDGLKGWPATRILVPLAPASGAEIFLGTDHGIFWTGDGGLHWRESGLQDETVLVLATFPPPDPVTTRRRR